MDPTYIHRSAGHQRTVAIIGGGFSGLSVATRLLRDARAGDLRVVLIERAPHVGRGVAYAARAFPYLLNVPAAGMSADADQPLDFVDFARGRGVAADASSFLPRALYGDYLEQRFLLALRTSAASFERMQRNAIDLTRSPERRWRVQFAGGTSIDADDVVLALGNPPPAPLRGAGELGDLLIDAWDETARLRTDQDVLIVGTGLTMADYVMRASASRNPPRLHAISRHGRLPAAQTDFAREAFVGDAAALQAAATTSLSALVSLVRGDVAEAASRGHDWREVVAFVRSQAPALWPRLAERERLRFLRHVRAHWDAHRHRLPSVTYERLVELRAMGLLRVRAARIERLERAGSGVRAVLRPRGTSSIEVRYFDGVVNCTGPDYCPLRTREPLLRSLLQQDLIAPDEAGTGLHTHDSGAVLDAARQVVPNLFYVGPMLRATHWEATSVPELRSHVARVTDTLLQRMTAVREPLLRITV